MARQKANIDLDEALALYNDKSVPFKEKAKRLGVSPDTLRNFLRNNGVDIPTKKGKAAGKLSVEKVTELYVNRNMSRKDAAKELGVSLATLGRFISDNKIQKDNAKIVELREQTMMDRYGVKHALDSDEFKAKARETCRDNFGVDYPMQSAEVMKKSRKSSLETWGTEHPQQSDRYKETHYTRKEKQVEPRYSELSETEKSAIQAKRSRKRKQTTYERYGVENPSQIPEVRERRRKTNEERYGDGEFFRTDTFKERATAISRQRYGTDHPMQSDEVKARAAATNMERYGSPSSLVDPEVKAKSEATNIERYGDAVPMRTEVVKQRQRDTLLERYGEDNPSKVPEFQEKKRQTNRERYGSDFYGRQKIAHLDEWEDKDRFADACRRLESELGRKPHVDDLMLYFNAGPTATYTRVSSYGCSSLVNMRTSYIEDRWRSWLKEEGIPCSERPERLLARNGKHPQEIDIYIPEYAVGIEVDPTSTHNSTVPYYNSSEPKAPSYHQKKTALAEQAGINLVHVYDFADEEKMRSIIKALCGKNERVYARNTVCELIAAKEEKTFLEANHLQGYVKSEVCYGLFSDDDAHELLALMSFGEPRYGTAEEKDIRWELLRFCSKDGISVVGGASKLFAAFVAEHAPSSVLSYANYDISNGNMYETLGFQYKRLTNPSYTWVKLGDPTDTYSWYVVNTKGFDNLFGTNYGKGTSNSQLMEEAGYVRVYNSGNKVYIWTAETDGETQQ